VGQQAFAGALGVLRSRKVETQHAVASLCDLSMDLTDTPWRLVLWDPNTRSMVNRNKTLAEALFLHMLREQPRTARYDVLAKYQELHGETRAPQIPLKNIR
jgi:hypothetical protein